MLTGHIRKRQAKDGKISYQITFETDPDPITGKRNRSYETVQGTKKEAQARLDQIRAEYLVRGNAAFAKPSTLFLEQWLQGWQRSYLALKSPTTRQGYEFIIRRRIVPVLGRVPLSQLNNRDVQEWVNHLTAKGLSAKTVKNSFFCLQSALQKAVKSGLISSNPCDDIVLPSVKKYVSSAYSLAEVKQILKIAAGTDIYFILAIELYLGLRVGELSALRWKDVDFEKRLIHVRENRVFDGNSVITKSPKSQAGVRDIPLIGEALTILQTEYQNRLHSSRIPLSADSFVVCKADGEPFVPNSISQKWERFRDKHGFRRLRFHDLRHTCATLMIAQNIPSKTVQTWLGHSSISITMDIYSHCLDSMKLAAGEQLDQMYR